MIRRLAAGHFVEHVLVYDRGPPEAKVLEEVQRLKVCLRESVGHTDFHESQGLLLDGSASKETERNLEVCWTWGGGRQAAFSSVSLSR